LEEVIKVILEQCMGLKPKEEVLIITDENLFELAGEFFSKIKKLDNEALLLEIFLRKIHGEEPPLIASRALEAANVALLLTSFSLSHTKARKNASAKGVRIASLPGATKEMLLRAIPVDYFRLQEKAEIYAKLLSEGEKVHLTSPAGCNLFLSLEGRKGKRDDGLYRNAGDFGNLPAGEAYIAPLEGTANGVIVFDGSLAGFGLISPPLRLRIKEGMVEEIYAHPYKNKLEEIFSKYGQSAKNIAELGIGLNPGAKLSGNVLEDEKIEGSIHIALGDNSTFGGKVEAGVHLDGVILNPTVLIDDLLVIKEGRLLF